MARVNEGESPPVGAAIGPDTGPARLTRWLTPRNEIVFTIGWIVAFSLGSLLVSNPFASEPSASAAPDYWHVMYLHGLLVSLVGLLALVACQVLSVRSIHTRRWIAVGVIVATVATAIGGIFDRRVPGAEAAMWTQVVGFFALDEILIAFLLGMWGEWRRRAAGGRSLAYATAALAAGSMFVAALMGHLAGWMLEFGGRPWFLAGYAHTLGIAVSDWVGLLVGSHSHDMAVGVMALTVTLAVVQFGGLSLRGSARAVTQVGLGLVAFGVALMTVMYAVMGLSTWNPPTLFQSAGGTNGIAGDDIVTGVLVMFGGLVALIGVLLPHIRRLFRVHPARLASGWAWLLSFGTVVVTGYAIELNETFFGAGSKAPGAANDAVFTWMHQDVGLFLLPAIALIMVAVERLVAPRYQGPIAWAAIIGTSVTFLGGMLFVFVDPALHGASYFVSMAGLLVTGLALLAALWGMVWGRTRPAAVRAVAAPGETPRAA